MTDDALIIVDMPEKLADLAVEFVQEKKVEVLLLVKLLESQEFERIRILAHNLKGTGASFGIPSLTDLGAAMEISARDADASTLSAQLAWFHHLLTRVRIAGRDVFAPPGDSPSPAAHPSGA